MSSNEGWGVLRHSPFLFPLVDTSPLIRYHSPKPKGTGMTDSQVKALQTSLYEMMERIERKEAILEQLEDIGRLQVEIADTAPQQLCHYLERRSYAKALEFLQHGLIHDGPRRPIADDEEKHL